MVVFTCNHCGDSLQKPKVEKHYSFVCRRPKSLTCVDCLKDFRGEEFAGHIKCVTEDERYGAKGTVQGGMKKGEIKQESWMSMIENISKQDNLKPPIRNLLNTMLNFNNVPRKKPKFMNFMKSSSGGRVNMKDVEEIWDIIEKYKNDNAQKNGTKNVDNAEEENVENKIETNVENGKKKSKKNVNNEEGEHVESKVETNVENGKKKSKKNVNNEEEEHVENQVEINVENGKKKSKKNVNNEEEEHVEDKVETKVKSGKKKSKKNVDNAEEENVENKIETNVENGKKKSKKNVNNEEGEHMEIKVETEVENGKKKSKKKKISDGESNEEIESKKMKLTGEKFSYEETILEILNARDAGISLKKLEKRVLKAYKNFNKDDECNSEKIVKKISKQLKKIDNVEVDEQMVKLIK